MEKKDNSKKTLVLSQAVYLDSHCPKTEEKRKNK